MEEQMRGLTLSVFGVALLCAAVPAIAADKEQVIAPNIRTAAGGADPTQVVCVHMDVPTGSRIGGGMQCHTVKEWADLERSGADQLYLVPRDNLSSGNGTAIGGGMQH
jgi:hypothetical protein